MEKAPSLAIGPLNTAGQAYQWAEAVERELAISAWSFAGTRRSSRRMNGPSHRRVLHARIPPRTLRRAWLRHILKSRTHLLVESSMAILGNPYEAMFTDELPDLNEAGLVVGGIFHGSDIRSPSAHMQRVKDSLYQLYEAPARDAMESMALKRRTALTVSNTPCFVSTPDLLFDLPLAVWLPLVVDVERWVCSDQVLTRRRPIVLHVPSRREPPIKGTKLIDPILLELDRRGVITYISPPAPLGRRQIQALVKSSDVVVDQLMIGSYGVTAVEGMAAGRLVLGHVGAQTRRLMPWEPPILDVTPENFESVVIQIAQRPRSFHDIARSGPDYVRETHSGISSARALEPFLVS